MMNAAPSYEGAFVLTPQGECILSNELSTSNCYPECYKKHHYGIKVSIPDGDLFTSDERERFLRNLRNEDIERLSQTLTSIAMDSLGFQNKIEDLFGILKERLTKAIQAACSTSSFLPGEMEN